VLGVLAVSAAAGVDVWLGNEVSLRNRLRLAFGEAKEEIVVVADRFTDYSLADALVVAARRGRRVRVVVAGDRRDATKNKALGDHLAGGGVEVFYDRGDADLYDRFIVIDDHIVIVGSYPFIEEAASSPMTDVVVIDDAGVAAQYLAFFDFIRNAAK